MCGGRRRLIRIDLKLLQTVLLIVLCIDDTRIRLSKPDCYSSVKIRDLHRQLVRLHAENRHLKQRLARKEAETRERKHQQQMKSSDQYKRLQVVLWRLQRNVGELWDFLRHKLKLEDLISYTRGWYQTTVAYGDSRTVIIDSYKWQYAPYKGSWESVFQAVSNSCTSFDSHKRQWWEKAGGDEKLVKLPIMESLEEQPPFIPLAVPKDLAPQISLFHRQPSLWWIGQIVSFLLRPSEDMQHDIDEFKKLIGFSQPIVGVHIRRTDKVGWEAELHSLDEYMNGVDDYYELLENRQAVSERQIYLATDDESVITTMNQRYPEYRVLSNRQAAIAAKQQRFSQTSLNGIITDVVLLSQTNYIVCTFSSQVCRLAYELMQSHHTDASQNAHSLDEMYYFGGQRPRLQRAISAHKPFDDSEIELEIGDVVSVRENSHGFFAGTSTRTSKYGRYPPYKVKDIIDEVDFPTYTKN